MRNGTINCNGWALNGVLACAIMGSFVACATPKADVAVSAVSLGSWYEHRDRLQPTFKADAEKLRADILSTTALSQEQISSGTFASAAVSVPTNAFPTGASADGASPTNSLGDGALVAADPAFSPVRAPDLPGLTTLGTVQEDVLLTYQLTASLYQEIQMLNTFVRDAAIPDGYIPYVVRMNVGVLPYTSRLDKDLHGTLVFTCRTRESLIAPGGPARGPDLSSWRSVRVIPMLVTDSIEAALRSRSEARLRELALRLSAGIGDVGAASNVRDFYERVRADLANDFNTTYQVIHGSENSIHLRIGAVNSARNQDRSDRSRQLLGRTVPVTALVLVPAEFFTDVWCPRAGTKRQPSPVLDVVSKFSYYNDEGERELPFEGRALGVKSGDGLVQFGKLWDQAERELQLFDTAINEHIGTLCDGVSCLGKGDSPGKLMLAVLDNDYQAFSKHFRDATPTCKGDMSLDRFMPHVWATIVETFETSLFSNAQFDLNLPTPYVDAPRSGLLIDDNGKTATVTVPAGTNLRALSVDARLELSHDANGDTTVMSPISTEISSGGNLVRLIFPSLSARTLNGKAKLSDLASNNTAKLHLTFTNPLATAMHNALRHTDRARAIELCACCEGWSEAMGSSGVLQKNVWYDRLSYVSLKPPPTPTPVKVTAPGRLIPDKGSTTLVVRLERKSTPTLKSGDRVGVRISGAQLNGTSIRGSTTSPGVSMIAATVIESTPGAWAKGVDLTLSLSGLQVGAPVTLHPQVNGKDAGGVKATSIIVTVDK